VTRIDGDHNPAIFSSSMHRALVVNGDWYGALLHLEVLGENNVPKSVGRTGIPLGNSAVSLVAQIDYNLGCGY